MKLNNLHDIFDYCNINNTKRIGIIFANPKLAEEGRRFYELLFGVDTVNSTNIVFCSIEYPTYGITYDELILYYDNVLVDSYTLDDIHSRISTSFIPCLRRPTFDIVQTVDVR